MERKIILKNVKEFLDKIGVCKLWRKVKAILIWTIVLLGIGSFLYMLYKHSEEQAEREKLENYPLEVMRGESGLLYYEYKSKLVKEVKAWIDSVAPRSSLNAYALVDCAERYDLDLKFVLAQAQLESHFGTTGMAVKTNSVFNVGAYDNLTFSYINGKYKYKHPDFSIEPYMRLLYRDYITSRKTELDLMGRFVNKNGLRYSSNKAYERDMLALYKRIDTLTKISEYQSEMRRYKIISGY